MGLVYIFRLVGFVGIALFIVSVFTPVVNVLGRSVGTPAQPGSAEAIVVLGGGLYPDGTLGNTSLRRAIQGIVLYKQGLAPLLVFLGEAHRGPVAEAVIRVELARRLGVPSEAILTETRAFTTREEAARVGEILRSKGIHKILLVTDSYHMARAKGVFEKIGFEALAAPADDFSTASYVSEDRLRLMRRILQELVARFYYKVAGYL